METLCERYLNSSSARYVQSVSYVSKHLSSRKGSSILKCIRNDSEKTIAYRWCGQQSIIQPGQVISACYKDSSDRVSVAPDNIWLGYQYQVHQIRSHKDQNSGKRKRLGSRLTNLFAKSVESFFFTPAFAALKPGSHSTSAIIDFSENQPEDMLRVFMKMKAQIQPSGRYFKVNNICEYTIQIADNSPLHQQSENLPIARISFNDSALSREMFPPDGILTIYLNDFIDGEFNRSLSDNVRTVTRNNAINTIPLTLRFHDHTDTVIGFMPGIKFEVVD